MPWGLLLWGGVYPHPPDFVGHPLPRGEEITPTPYTCLCSEDVNWQEKWTLSLAPEGREKKK
jgi:hypothetical protein